MMKKPVGKRKIAMLVWGRANPALLETLEQTQSKTDNQSHFPWMDPQGVGVEPRGGGGGGLP